MSLIRLETTVGCRIVMQDHEILDKRRYKQIEREIWAHRLWLDQFKPDKPAGFGHGK